MRVVSFGGLAILAAISRCGGGSGGEPDTSGVATDTAGEARDVAPVDELEPTFVGFAGTRFAVFAAAERTFVFDVEAADAFEVPGPPFTRPDVSFDTAHVVASQNGSILLVRTERGARAVDLGGHGALLGEWVGEVKDVDLAPDGATFAVWSRDELAVVRTRDGAGSRHRVADAADAADSGEHDVRWTTDAAYWTDADGLRIVMRTALTAQHVALKNASATASKDGSTFVLWRGGLGSEPGMVEVVRAAEPGRVVSRLASAFVSDVTIDDHGRRVAWSESSGDLDAPTFLHTLDVVSGVHARFPAKGPRCPIDFEHVVGFEDGALMTDARCSPGCPSIAEQSHFITYDVASGQKLREWKGELQPSYNDLLAARASAREADDRLLRARMAVKTLAASR